MIVYISLWKQKISIPNVEKNGLKLCEECSDKQDDYNEKFVEFKT